MVLHWLFPAHGLLLTLCPGPALPATQVKERASKAVPHIQQVKILLDDTRPGPDGAPRSKGIGFVEFTEHEHAISALRQLNNNPKPFGKVRALGCDGHRQHHMPNHRYCTVHPAT